MSIGNKALGTALENRVAARARAHGLEATRQPGSGTLKGHPKDAIIEDLLVEAKVRATHTNAEGEECVTLRLQWLRACQVAGRKHGFRAGILVVNPKHSRAPLVVCDLDDFLDLLAHPPTLSGPPGRADADETPVAAEE